MEDKVKEVVQAEEVLDVADLPRRLKESTGYMLGVTLLENGILNHHFFTNNFPTLDIKESMKHINKLSTDVSKPRANKDVGN